MAVTAIEIELFSICSMFIIIIIIHFEIKILAFINTLSYHYQAIRESKLF